MEYQANPDAVFENINRALGDAIQTAIIGGLFYACKQYKKKPKLMRVQHSSTACPLCQSHCGEYSVDEFETSKASEFHRGCRCKLIVSWKEESSTEPTEKPKLSIEDGCKLKAKEKDVANIYVASGKNVTALKPSGKKRTPDFVIDGERAELKQPIGDNVNKTVGKNTIDHQFENANGQARYLILDFTEIEKYGDDILKNCIEDAKNKALNKWTKEFGKVEVVYANKISRLK